MQNIFENIDNNRRRLSSNFLDEILSHPTDSISQIEKQFEKVKADYNHDDLNKIFMLYENFSDDNAVSSFILQELFTYYLENVSYLINNDIVATNIFLDTFSRNLSLFNNHSKNELFAQRTYPLLLLPEDVNSGSDLDVSIDIFLELLTHTNIFENGINLIHKFLKENPKNPYAHDLELKIKNS